MALKTTSSTVLLVLLFSSASLAAELFYAPGFCDPKSLTVYVENKSAETQPWWTQVYDNGFPKEVYQDVDAHSDMKISGSSFMTEQRAFTLKSGNANSLKFTLNCDGKKVLPSSTTSPQVTHFFPAKQTAIKLSVLNLFLNANDVTLKAYDTANALLEEKTLHFAKNFETQNLKWSFNTSVARIDISAPNRFHSEAFYGDEEKQSPPLAMTPVSLPTGKTKKYFLISTKAPSENGSFVIGSDDEETIATAREQISRPELEKIVVARISLGSDGINRNFQARDKAPYSWNVNYVDAFGDFAHIDCDGNPDLVEERLQQRLNDGGRICFWRYRVVRELTPAEVSSGILDKNTP